MAKAVPDVPCAPPPSRLGCAVTWNAVGPQRAAAAAIPAEHLRQSAHLARGRCTAGHARSTSARSRIRARSTAPIADLKELPQDYVDGKPILETGVADAQCVDGLLLVSEIRSSALQRTPDRPRQLSRL